MVRSQGAARSVRRRLAWKLMAGAAILVLATGCNRTGKKDGPAKRLAAFDYSNQARRPALKPTNPLHIAATKWARAHQKNPSDPIAALNYARTLKAIGTKDRALEVLARSYQLNPGNAKLASEYGRLALDLGKVQMAEQLLNRAQRAKGQTDWRVLSALGTVNAKRGKHKKAQSYYLAALRQKPDATSVFNNLALSYALDGRVGDAEDLLKRAVSKGHNTRRVRQNLALVLGLQSKFGEAQKVAQADLTGDKIDNNASYMRDMVKTTKVARAKMTAKDHTKTGAITTAALPKQKKKVAAAGKSTAQTPLPRRKPSAPVKTASAAAKAKPTPKASRKTQAVKAQSRRIAAKTAQPVVRHAPAAKATARNNTAVMPWHKKPVTARRSVRTVKLSTKSPGTPTNILPQANPSWSVAVTQGTAPAPRAANTARKEPDPFEIPEDN